MEIADGLEGYEPVPKPSRFDDRRAFAERTDRYSWFSPVRVLARDKPSKSTWRPPPSGAEQECEARFGSYSGATWGSHRFSVLYPSMLAIQINDLLGDASVLTSYYASLLGAPTAKPEELPVLPCKEDPQSAVERADAILNTIAFGSTDILPVYVKARDWKA